MNDRRLHPRSRAQTMEEVIRGGRRQLLAAIAAIPLALGLAAQSHSEDMAARNYFDHYWWGENIYRGGASAQEAFTWWKGSPGHNSNMLSTNFEEIGLGRAFDGGSGHWLWTTVFASPVLLTSPVPQPLRPAARS